MSGKKSLQGGAGAKERQQSCRSGGDLPASDLHVRGSSTDVPRRSIAKSSFSLRTSAKQPTSHYIIHRASGFFWLFNHRSDRETKRRTALEPTQATGYEDTIIALSMGSFVSLDRWGTGFPASQWFTLMRICHRWWKCMDAWIARDPVPVIRPACHHRRFALNSRSASCRGPVKNSDTSNCGFNYSVLRTE
ncbi:uncharacterized protein CIMG_03470 [Coccidioides immitis RS]|uniref:Uncharacterized protein n=1 Tax=Coccidioides immitis (strain RS) TaxID=246410 RepID=J3KBF7_COCIM|nr:uncharacterized protein CIMG_03470 [Coccidioides immitis RS]EAS32446.3 hypothetical protein CIMG_03470 [Coccidioides immitis RS]